MRYHVSDECIGCGLCTSICPEVFSLNESGFSQAIEDEVPEAALERAAEAMDSCPAGAIGVL